MDSDYSEDSLLGGKIKFIQPVKGYRVAIDPVLLAASIPAEKGSLVLDAGSGGGAASLCLATRVPGCRIVGIEFQKEYARLAVNNVRLNQLSDRIEVIQGDLMTPPPRLAASTFDHVMTNPPYLEHARGRDSTLVGKTLSHKETAADLKSWLKFCALMVKPKGFVTVIHRADRLDQILTILSSVQMGNIHVFPLWPGKSKPAKRIIVRAQKNSSTPLTFCHGLVLHEENGDYTADVQSVLWHGSALSLA